MGYRFDSERRTRMGMMTFERLDHTGHSPAAFDKNDEAAMAKARALFNEITEKGERLGETPARTPGQKAPEVVKDFNPEADSYTTVRPIQGG
jgi:hypothetical protein